VNFTFQVVFATHFLADTLRCQFINTGLQFSLWSNFMTHGYMNVWKKKQWACSVNLSSLFFGYRDGGLFLWDDCCLFCGLLVSSPVIMFRRNCRFLWSLCCWSWHNVDVILLLLRPQRAGHVQIVFQNSLNWRKSNSQQVWSFMDSHSSVFRSSSFTWSTYSSVFFIYESS
jgi:hypothetical protein